MPGKGPVLGKVPDKYAIAGRMLNLGSDIRRRVEVLETMASRPNQMVGSLPRKASLASATSRSAEFPENGEVSPWRTIENGLIW